MINQSFWHFGSTNHTTTIDLMVVVITSIIILVFSLNTIGVKRFLLDLGKLTSYFAKQDTTPSTEDVFCYAQYTLKYSYLCFMHRNRKNPGNHSFPRNLHSSDLSRLFCHSASCCFSYHPRGIHIESIDSIGLS